MNVATVRSSAFVAVELEDGNVAVVCRGCGGSLRLRPGRTDARLMQHDVGCAIGAVLVGTSKPVMFAERAPARAH